MGKYTCNRHKKARLENPRSSDGEDESSSDDNIVEGRENSNSDDAIEVEDGSDGLDRDKKMVSFKEKSSDDDTVKLEDVSEESGGKQFTDLEREMNEALEAMEENESSSDKKFK